MKVYVHTDYYVMLHIVQYTSFTSKNNIKQLLNAKFSVFYNITYTHCVLCVCV